MRCVAKQQQAERDEYVRKNRREVDRFAGLTDSLDIICELQTWRKPDPLAVYKPFTYTSAGLYAGLTLEQRNRLVAVAIQERKAGNKDLSETIAKSLATLTDHDISELAIACLDEGEFRPSVLFRGANAVVRDRIIRFLVAWNKERHGTLAVNHALCALAWIGDAEVQSRFAAWERDPLVWRSDLHVGPKIYAHTGGWEPSVHGRRELVFNSCWAIIPLQSPEPADRSVVPFAKRDSACPWCSRPLVNMLSIDGTDPRFAFLGWMQPRLEILTCDACTCFTDHLFSRIAADGTAAWHPANIRPKAMSGDHGDWGASPWQGVSIRIQVRGGLEAVEPDVGVSASQIGGHPCWVQDTAYPACPDCFRTMRFVAQLDNENFKHHEGSYYAFLCTDCRVTATCYQQT